MMHLSRRKLPISANNLALYSALMFCVFTVRFLVETTSMRARVAVLRGSPPPSHADDALLVHHEFSAIENDDFSETFDDDYVATTDEYDARAPFSIGTADYTFSYNTTGLTGMNDWAYDFFKGTTCNRFLPPGSDVSVIEQGITKRTVVSIRFNCMKLFQKSIYGTGNYISAIYALRLAAATAGNVDVEFICDDAEEQKDALILPWMTGWFPHPSHPLPNGPTTKNACSSYKSAPITHMVDAMQWELRRMAIALVGVPDSKHPAAQWAEEHLWRTEAEAQPPMDSTLQLASPTRESAPIYQNVELDDAVLHFRCGDLISSNHPSFGFMKFGSFSRHLPSNITSIGIVTQPFDPSGQTRKYDGGAKKQVKCKKVVHAFVDHLQEQFPNARISIRNDAKETIALTFARMVMAQHVVVGISSFGAFPAVATFGTGYIRKPDYQKAPNRWLLEPSIEEVVQNVKLVEEPKLMAVQCQRRWGKDGSAVIEWFRDYAAE